MTNKWTIIVLFAVSAIIHFAFFGRPNKTVFDEVHFGKFVSGYYTGEYYFDIHPPLGKLIIAGFAKIADFKPDPSAGKTGYNFTEIGKEFPDRKYLVLRFLPTAAGTLLPIIIYLLILELGMSRRAALTGGLFTAFDNALLAQSRLMLLDPFLLLFGFSTLLFYLKYSKHEAPSTKYLILTAISGGMAASVKWTGLTFLTLPVLSEAYKCFAGLSYAALFKLTKRLLPIALISAGIYFSFFALHFMLLPKPGPGDVFMKPDFRQNNIIRNIVDLNMEMYKSNQRLTATHPYSSQWYSWPFMARPIFYWVSETSRIYFLGNPIIWWTSTAAVIMLLLRNFQFLIFNVQKKFNFKNFKLNTEHILLGGYVINLLPFMGIKRAMFLYHYLTALIFAILMLVYLLDTNKNAKRNFGILIVASIAAFIFFAPLSYGLPLSDKAYEARVWFAGWM